MNLWKITAAVNLVIGIFFHTLGTLTAPLVFLMLGTLALGFLFERGILEEPKELSLTKPELPIEATEAFRLPDAIEINSLSVKVDMLSTAIEAQSKALQFLVEYVQGVQQLPLAAYNGTYVKAGG